MVYPRFVPVASAAVLVFSLLACSLGASPPAADQAGREPPFDETAPTSPSSPLASGDCANPLSPVTVGATWNYAMSGVTSDTFVRSITAVHAQGFTDQDVFASGVTRTGEWKCSAGALVALNPNGGTTASVQTTDVDANFQTTLLDGVTLPAAVNAGDTWAQNITIEGTQNLNGTDVISKNAAAFTCTAGGIESVSVPAGSFDAQRVECQVDMTITVTMNGIEVPTTFTSTSTAWYAPGVGMVKAESVSTDMGNSTLELTGYTIP
jgi:hypothetical protein